MKQKTQQTTFDYQPPVKIPDFCGDFGKEMDFIKSLPEEDWWRAFDALEDVYD